MEIAFPIRRKTRADPGRVEELSIAVNELNEWNVLREDLLELRCHFAAPLGIGGVQARCAADNSGDIASGCGLVPAGARGPARSGQAESTESLSETGS